MIFGKKKEGAIAYVDYEHWYISMKNLYGVIPDLKSWAAEIRSKYDVKDILFFANFANPAFKSEIPRLREVTSTIIETQIRDDAHPMKDMSDVVMIDAIYRQLEDRHSPKVFILFTGDGHFQPVVRHLAQDRGKKVVLYGVKNSTSRLLKDAATECHEVPDSEAQVELCYRLITEEFDRLFQRYGEIITSFSSLTQRISEENNIPRQTVEIALHDMMDRGWVTKKRRTNRVSKNSFDNILPEWDKLIDAGLIDAEE